MTTVTLPREVAKQALDAFEEAKMGLEWYQTRHPESVDGSDDEAMERIDAGIASLRAALDVPAKPVDCRGCKHHYIVQMVTVFDTFERQMETDRCALHGCTDFDKFQALPPISLTKVTK